MTKINNSFSTLTACKDVTPINPSPTIDLSSIAIRLPRQVSVHKISKIKHLMKTYNYWSLYKTDIGPKTP